jgi:hypothetical protein
VLCGVGAFWLYMVNAVPNVHIPPPLPLPKPNAHDYYLDASSRIVSLGGASSSSDVDLAASQYGKNHVDPGSHVYTVAEKEKIVDLNRNALAMVRQGFGYQYRNPPLRSFESLVPENKEFRSVARLLTIEAEVKAVHGDWSGALQADIDAIRMGRDVPRGGNVLLCLCGFVVQRIGQHHAWEVVDHIDAASARSAVRRLEDVIDHRVPLSEVIEEDKWSTASGLLEQQRKMGWRAWNYFPNTGNQGNVWTEFLDYSQAITMNKRAALNEYVTYLDKLIANSRYRYAELPPESPEPRNYVVRCFVPILGPLKFTQARCQTSNQLLAVTAALRGYKLEHGRYPDSLSQLVPSYLSKVPQDEFAKSGSLRYRRKGDSYLLYSIGPDGKDNRGAPITDPAYPKDSTRRHAFTRDSKGDIVAGVNR